MQTFRVPTDTEKKNPLFPLVLNTKGQPFIKCVSEDHFHFTKETNKYCQRLRCRASTVIRQGALFCVLSCVSSCVWVCLSVSYALFVPLLVHSSHRNPVE